MQTKMYILIYFYYNIKILKNLILKKIFYFKQIFKYLKIFVFLKNLKKICAYINFCTTKKDFVFFIQFKKKQCKKKIIKIFI